MRKLLIYFLMCCATMTAQRVNYNEGAITIEGDTMLWTFKTDGTQYPWVTSRYQWGKSYYEADGEIAVNTERRQDDSDIIETYCFTNTSRHKVTWVNALRMSGMGPHLGLMVTEGNIDSYDVWERGSKKGMSNFRGVLALCPPDMTLKPGQSYRLTWRIFTHQGSDFDEQLLRRGGMAVRSDKYVYAVGETAKVDFITSRGTKTVSRKITATGETDIEYKGTHALLLGISGENELMEKRIRFVLDRQQMQDKDDARYGAFMIFDNEGDSLLTCNQNRSDLSEGRERVGLGIAFATYGLNEKVESRNEKLLSVLERYAKFVREQLQYPDYRTKSNVNGGKNRGYNYAWVADFYFRMALLTGEAQYARDGYATLQSLYRQFGYGFYCIDYPVTTGLQALQNAGMNFEYDMLLQDFKATADIL